MTRIKIENPFMFAAVNKLRFEIDGKHLSVEDVASLPYESRTNTSLQKLYGELTTEQAKQPVKKLGSNNSNVGCETLDAKIAIVEEIYNYRVEVRDAKNDAEAIREKKRLLMEAIAKEEVSELIDGKSLKKLKKELAALDAD